MHCMKIITKLHDNSYLPICLPEVLLTVKLLSILRMLHRFSIGLGSQLFTGQPMYAFHVIPEVQAII